jgi:hypothetical protein
MASTKIEKQDDVTTEGTLTGTTPETTESATTEKPESEATLTPAAFVVDVTFLVGSATPADDGTLTADQDKVNELFRSVDKSDRSKAKAALTDAIRARMLAFVPGNEHDTELLKGLVKAEASLTAAAPKASVVPSDPRPGMIRALFALKAAEAALTEQLGDLSEAESATVADEADVERVTKAALPKGGHTFTGERGDIAAHVTEAFADKNSGDFLTVAQIRAFPSKAYEGRTPPSAGAIEARLLPTDKDG